MAPRPAFDCIDALLQDIVDINMPFGGKVLAMGGDWRPGTGLTVASRIDHNPFQAASDTKKERKVRLVSDFVTLQKC